MRFVQLTAPLSVLESRVDSEERKYHKKITDATKLKDSLSRYNMNVSVPYDKIVKLDTSLLKPSESVRRIVEYFKLATL